MGPSVYTLGVSPSSPWRLDIKSASVCSFTSALTLTDQQTLCIFTFDWCFPPECFVFFIYTYSICSVSVRCLNHGKLDNVPRTFNVDVKNGIRFVLFGLMTPPEFKKWTDALQTNDKEEKLSFICLFLERHVCFFFRSKQPILTHADIH